MPLFAPRGALRQDVRLALRTLLARPALTLAALVALGLGIGATTALVAVVDAVLVRPLDYADADRLVVVLHDGRHPVAPANYLDWQRSARTLPRMNAAETWGPTLTGTGRPEQLAGLHVTGDMMPMLGARATIGRALRAEDGLPGAAPVVVLSHALWQRRFAGAPDVLGRALVLDGTAHEVVGVMPPSFRFAPFWATRSELWAPLDLSAKATSRNGQSLRVFARLAPGTTLDAARAEVAAITARLEREHPGTNTAVQVVPLKERVVGDVRPTLLVLLGAVVLVLLLACANVAHLLLARAAARTREMAVRTALGATRAALVRQQLVESVLLALAGGVAGVGVGAAGVRVLRAMGPGDLPRLDEVGLDARVLLLATLVTLATGVACGVVPALRAAAAGVATTLRDGGRGSSGGARQRRGRRMLIASEFALAVVLLVGAGLMLRSVARLQAFDPGLDRERLLTAVVPVRGTADEAAGRREAFYRALVERLQATPGVRAASAAAFVPLGGDVWGTEVATEGAAPGRPGEVHRATWRVSMPGYLRTMGIALRAGRDVAESDVAGGESVVVINASLARELWPGEQAVGRRITLAPGRDTVRWLTVVGVTDDAVRGEWGAPAAGEVYVPYAQEASFTEGPFAWMSVVVRTTGDAATFAPTLRAIVGAMNADVPVSQVATMEELVARATARPRFVLVLLVAFASVAAVLAAVGLYGVTSHAVAQRTRELGIRVALGARGGDVARLVVGEALGLIGVGVVAGLLAAFALSRGLAGMLPGVEARDPATFALVPVVLGVVALLAAWAPARRATRADPLEAMRGEG